MNYTKHYELLITRGKNRVLEGYVERHHIIPRCMGGTDDAENIVQLTPEEHYLAHQLLVKMYPESIELVGAALMMTRHTTNKRMNNKLFGWLRVRASLLTRGIPKSEDTKKKMSKPKSKSHCLSISVAQLQNGGNGPEHHSAETKAKIKKWGEENSVFKLEVSCPHCGKSGKNGPMKRFHFQNCITLKQRVSMRKVQCSHCDVIGGVSAMKKWHFDNCKHKDKIYE
jgi:hypothetical protein